MDRYGIDPRAVCPASGWRIERVAGPSPLFGANGMRFGPDGRLFVAQAFGSQVSAIDVSSGVCEPVVPVGGEIVAPDDLAFDSRGILYATEVMSARVSARFPDGSTRVVAHDVPSANGITVERDRIFMDEFRPEGRLFELFPDGRAPRQIARGLPMPNALALGPDGHLYFPAVAAGEVWRVPVEGGLPERFVDGLDHPTAVKFDSRGRLHAVQAGSGEVTRIDLPGRSKTRLAKVRPGIDNFAFSADGRLFLSHFVDGGVAEITADGAERAIVAPGFIGPMGIAVDSDGRVFVADGLSVAVIDADGSCSRAGHLLQAGFPGFVRGIAFSPKGVLHLTNSAGDVVTYRPGRAAESLATRLGELYGIAISLDGAVLVADAAEGKVVRIDPDGGTSVFAKGLSRPKGVAVGSDGAVFVAESGKGRVVRVDGESTPVIDGLGDPHGLALQAGVLHVVDRARKSLVGFSLERREAKTFATDLPVGEAPGVVPAELPGLPGMIPGPIGTFTGVAAGLDGSIYVAADGEGSVIRVSRASLPGGRR